LKKKKKSGRIPYISEHRSEVVGTEKAVEFGEEVTGRGGVVGGKKLVLLKSRAKSEKKGGEL